MSYEHLMAESVWIVPLVVAIVQTIKTTGFATKYAPIFSIAVGVGLAFLVNVEMPLNEIVLSGVLYGLSASGLYSGVRTTQAVRDVKTGKLELEKVDIDKFDDKDLEIIQQNQQSQDQSNKNS